MNNILHIRGQEAWHDSIIIQGTEEAIGKLKESCEKALEEKGFPIQFNTFVNDGEGYNVEIQVMSNEHMERVDLPYYGDFTKTKLNEKGDGK